MGPWSYNNLVKPFKLENQLSNLHKNKKQETFMNYINKYVKNVYIELMFYFQADILDENKQLISAVDYYFLEDDGGRFKVELTPSISTFEMYIFIFKYVAGNYLN